MQIAHETKVRQWGMENTRCLIIPREKTQSMISAVGNDLIPDQSLIKK